MDNLCLNGTEDDNDDQRIREFDADAEKGTEEENSLSIEETGCR